MKWLLAWFNTKYRTCHTGWHTWNGPLEWPKDPAECLTRDIQHTCTKCGLTEKMTGWRYGINSYPDYSRRIEKFPTDYSI